MTRKWRFGLTADEWLSLAAAGEDSELGRPCCGPISQLRAQLNELATEQAIEYPIDALWLGLPLLRAYEAAALSHPDLEDPEQFPLLHQVLAGVRADVAQAGSST